MKLGFTGTQNGMNSFQKNEVTKYFDKYYPNFLHHGDCIGADSQCHNSFLEWHCANDTEKRVIVIHPPSLQGKRAWCGTVQYMEKFLSKELIGKLLNCKFKVEIQNRDEKPYLKRNRDIVDEAQVMIATPKELEHTLRSGTWATIRYAWKVKRVIFIIPPIESEKQ